MTKYNTVITISRQYGSGGRVIGKLLAESLGVPFYDRELITMAAERSGLSHEVLEKADERASNSLLYSLAMGTFMNPGIAGIQDLPLNDQVYLAQADVIKRAAAEGPCVIVGRCADAILAENPNLVRVFISADMKSRVERATTLYGLSTNKAEETIRKMDKKRANYYNFYTNRKWGIASEYDLCLRSDKIGPEACVEIIKRYVESRQG